MSAALLPWRWIQSADASFSQHSAWRRPLGIVAAAQTRRTPPKRQIRSDPVVISRPSIDSPSTATSYVPQSSGTEADVLEQQLLAVHRRLK
jgi:hypothetical protein